MRVLLRLNSRRAKKKEMRGREKVGINRKSVDENRRDLGSLTSLPLSVAGGRRHDVLSLAAEN